MANRNSNKDNEEFVPTKAFEDAKTRLQQKNILIIKGNSGDGKTRTARELLLCLSRGDFCADERGNRIHNKRLIEIYTFNDLDKIKPDDNLAVFIDDITMDEFRNIQQREFSMISSLFYGTPNATSNCLIITVQNDVLAMMPTCAIFQEEYIIDTSSEEYNIEQERRKILEIYTPKQVKFSDAEKSEIVNCVPMFGFPQVCRWFKDHKEVHKNGVEYFRKPFQFMQKVLSKLGEGMRETLLYLFLCGGKILEGDLNPDSDKSSQKLKEAFRDDIFDTSKSFNGCSQKKKLKCVRESLEYLSKFLVLKQQPSEGQAYYTFSHDSVQDTVAFVYGKASSMRFIKNCPYSYLQYITTFENITNKITISCKKEYIYERLLKELKCKQSAKYKCIASLDVWEDTGFVSRFFTWLDGKGVDKDFHLNWTTKDHFTYTGDIYRYMGEDCSERSFTVFVAETHNHYLLTKLVERSQRKDHPQLTVVLFNVVRAGHLSVLKDITEPGSCIIQQVRAKQSQLKSNPDFVNVNVLHEACLFGNEEIVKMLASRFPSLLSEKCGEHSILHAAAETRNCSLYDTVEKLLISSINQENLNQYLVDDSGSTVLHRSCTGNHVNTEFVLYLLKKYPELALNLDECGYQILHVIAEWSNKDLLTAVHSHLQKQFSDDGMEFEITKILTKDKKSVLDVARVQLDIGTKPGQEGQGSVQDMYKYLSKLWQRTHYVKDESFVAL